MITDLELSHPLFMFKLSFLWYNEIMTIINQFVTLASHLVFIGLASLIGRRLSKIRLKILEN